MAELMDLSFVQDTLNNDFWSEYARQGQEYLNRDVFKETPLTGEILADSAKSTYERTGKYIPLYLALSQAQLESSMGTRGRSPITNPYNVGEFDEGTTMTFDTTQEGVQKYFDLMADDYLRDRQPVDLLENFTNYRGDRYASNPEYEANLKSQIEYIKNFLNR